MKRQSEQSSSRYFPSARPGTRLIEGVVRATLFLALFSAVPAASQNLDEGEEFTIVLPFFSIPDFDPRQEILILVRSRLGAEVTFSWGEGSQPDRTLTIPPGGSNFLKLDTADLPLPGASGQYRRILQARADNPVNMTVVLDRGTASEAYEVIPHRFFGYEYVTMNERSLVDGSVVVVAAIEDSTIVRITPSVPTLEGAAAGVPFEVRLDSAEVYQIVSQRRIVPEIDDDLSGTRIVADRPVGVFSATTCTNMPVGNITCNPLIEQLPHVDALGVTHVLPIFPDERTTFLKGVPVCPPTRVRSPELLPALDQTFEGETGTLYRVGSSGVIRSEGPMLLGHISTNLSRFPPDGVRDTTGDPTLSLLTSERQMASSYLVEIPSLLGRVDGSFAGGWIHHLTVTRVDQTSTVTVNGQPFAMTGNVGSARFFPGLYNVQATGPIAVTLHGRSVSDGYAFVPGLITREFELMTDTLRGDLCADGLDTTITLVNRSGGRVRIDRGAFINGLEGAIDTPLPVTLEAGESVDLAIRISGRSERHEGRLMLYEETNGCPRRIMAGRIILRRVELDLIPPGPIRFADIFPPIRTADTVIAVVNSGRDTVTIVGVPVEPASFRVTGTTPSLPVRLAPGDTVEVRLRFRSEPGDTRVDGRILFLTEPCPVDSLWSVDLFGVVRSLQVLPPELLRDTLLCDAEVTDTLITRIVNRESLTISLDSIELAEGEPGEFELIGGGGNQPQSIAPGDTLVLLVRYRSGSLDGDRRATLRMWGRASGFDPMEVELAVRLESYRFEVTGVNLDFGRAVCDSISPRTITIRNTGTLPINHQGVRLLIGEGFELSESGVRPIEAGGEIGVVIRPDVLFGTFVDTVEIRDSLCGTTLLLPVSASCLDYGTITLRLPNLTGAIGDLLELPLLLERKPEQHGLGARFRLECVIRYRGDILYPGPSLAEVPDGVTGVVVDRRVDPDLTAELRLRFEGRMTASPALARLPLSLLLGEGNYSELSFREVDFTFDDASIVSEVATEDGSVSLDGYCQIGGTRWIDAEGTFGMKVVTADGRITLLLDLVEDGVTTATLYSAEGREVATLLDAMPGPGRWRVDEERPVLTAGLYFIRLRTPTQILVQPVLFGE